MRLLKIVTTRNAFTREYGTWLILLFNLAFVPLLLRKFSFELFAYFLALIFGLMLRFELLDYFSMDLQFSKAKKLARAFAFLLLIFCLFLFLVANSFFGVEAALIISAAGILMLVLNIATRRRKGRRQNIFSQIVLVCFVTFLGALNYYFLTGRFDHIFISIFLFSTLFYVNSLIYVRSKTVGPPFDTLALLFSIAVIILLSAFSLLGALRSAMIVVFIPMLVKTLDNVILLNTKVPLRRVGLNETVHCMLFMILYILLS